MFFFDNSQLFRANLYNVNSHIENTICEIVFLYVNDTLRFSNEK